MHEQAIEGGSAITFRFAHAEVLADSVVSTGDYVEDVSIIDLILYFLVSSHSPHRLQALFQAASPNRKKGLDGLQVPYFPGPPFLAGPYPCLRWALLLFRQVPCLGEVHLKIKGNNYHLFHASVF